MNNIRTKALQSQLVRRTVFAGLIVFASFVAVTLMGIARSASFVVPVQAAQQAITGEWVADFNRQNQDEVQFTIIRR